MCLAVVVREMTVGVGGEQNDAAAAIGFQWCPAAVVRNGTVGARSLVFAGDSGYARGTERNGDGG